MTFTNMFDNMLQDDEMCKCQDYWLEMHQGRKTFQ